MSTTCGSVIDAVLAALATINGTGVYENNLSVTGQVVEGDPPDQSVALSSVCVFVDTGSLISENAPELGRFRRELVVQVYGFVPAAADTPKSRKRATLSLLDDICAAIEADRSLGNLVIDLIVQGRAFTGSGWGAPSIGVAYAEIVVYWWADPSGGV